MKWTSTDDIKQTGQEFREERCVAIGGLFPGLRWRGAYLAASLYMRASQSIIDAATALQDLVIGHDRSFLAGIYIHHVCIVAFIVKMGSIRMGIVVRSVRVLQCIGGLRSQYARERSWACAFCDVEMALS